MLEQSFYYARNYSNIANIAELDLLQNPDLNRLGIYTSVSLKVVRKLITCVTKASKKSFYEQLVKFDLDFVCEPLSDSEDNSIPELV